MHQISTKYTRQQAFRGIEQQEMNEANNPEFVEKHHIMSHGTNSPINIYSFVRENHLDPAKKVSLTSYAVHFRNASSLNNRGSLISSRTTFSVVLWIANLTAICMRSSQAVIVTQSGSKTILYSSTARSVSTIQLMIFGATVIP